MLTIHVGLHKTGSTAIQMALTRLTSRELQGIRYRGVLSLANNDGFLPEARRGFCVPVTADRTPTVRLLTAGKSVVLSSENFLGSPFAPNEGGAYDRAVWHVESMRNYFQNKSPFQVVVYVRPQHEWLESLFNQFTKLSDFREVGDSRYFADVIMGSPFFRWTRLVTDMKQILGPSRLVVRQYGRGTDSAADFLEVLGIPIPSALSHAQPHNLALTPERAALQVKLAEALTAAGKPEYYRWVRNLDARSQSLLPTPVVSYFAEEVQARLIEISATDWADLPAVVADTHLAKPQEFVATANRLIFTQPKPYLGPLSDVPCCDEAVQLLVQTLPYFRTHPRTVLMRARKKIGSISLRARSESRDLPRAAVRSATRSLSRIRAK